MKSFLKNIFLFILMNILLLCCVVIIPYYIINKKSNFVINKKYKIIVFGHSHPECAFNDSLIQNFKNLSHSAEPYFYTYQKIKMVIAQNRRIETVLIEFSNNQIDEKMNDWTWGYKYMSNMFPQYEPFMDRPDIDLLIKNNSKDFLNCVSISTRQNLFRVITSNYNFSGSIGSYLKIEGSDTGSLKQASKTSLDNKASLDSNDKKGYNLSMMNIEYLRKIINYCKHEHKKVLLVRSPQHKDFEFRKNEKIFYQIKNNYFSDVDLLDFNNFPLKDDEFADYGHLNYKGAFKFSNYFNSILKSGILSTRNKQLFIDTSIIALKKKTLLTPLTVAFKGN
ncbi:MAG: hypothetical protein JWQ54_5312 [Mucilaginibacter sp.]|nr:hypothetical protein [Mucilaginibacter sp.]